MLLEHTKSIKEISLVVFEANTYKWSRQIADFNYLENYEILKKICTTVNNKTDIFNILYLASLVELLGDKYINAAIILNTNKFMIVDGDFSNTINKYLGWQPHTAASYTIMMRKAAKIIDYKYKQDAIKIK